MKQFFKDMFEESFIAGIIVSILCLGLVFGALCFEGWIVMLLWNAIIINLIPIGALTFWKAVGLLVLCNILFKGIKSCCCKGE